MDAVALGSALPWLLVRDAFGWYPTAFGCGSDADDDDDDEAFASEVVDGAWLPEGAEGPPGAVVDVVRISSGCMKVLNFFKVSLYLMYLNSAVESSVSRLS